MGTSNRIFGTETRTVVPWRLWFLVDGHVYLLVLIFVFRIASSSNSVYRLALFYF